MRFDLADLFESVADAVSERTALVCGEQRRSFAQLDRRANQCAHALVARGVKAGDVVGLNLMNGAESLEAMIGCFEMRAVPVNLNFGHVEDELRYLLDDAGAVAVILQRSFAPRLAAVRDRLAQLRTVHSLNDGSGVDLSASGSTDYESALAGAGCERDLPERSPDDLFMLYTSGTTGMPKGVMWRQEDLFSCGMLGANPSGAPPTRPEEVAERAAAGTPNAGMAAAPSIHGAAQLGTWIALLQGWKVCLVPLGYLARPEADGTARVFGRGSQCIDSGGEKIFPEEVEGALESHADVFDAVVTLIQVRPGRSATPEDVIAHSRKPVAGYEAPRFLHAVDEIVHSPNGKPDYPWAKEIATEAALTWGRS